MKHKFEGKHWLATVREVDVSNNAYVKNVVETALIQSGANIVGYNEYVFENGALTCCFLLAESHCTVHTYPENRSLWLDCFTCGETFHVKKFSSIITSGFHSGFVESRIITRR